MFGVEYFKAIKEKFVQTYNKIIRKDYELQSICDNCDDYYTLFDYLKEYNLKQTTLYLASGLSCYFNEQIDQNGLRNLKLKEEDREDIKFIISCFGGKNTYGDNNLSIIYTSLLGTVEFNYGMQTFPAGIFEDVFGCSIDHEFLIQPLVGETEVNFFLRIMKYRISNYQNFPVEYKEEVLMRTKRLVEHFINGYNRIYLIPFDNVLDNKASFGDVRGLRDGTLKLDDVQKILSNQRSFRKILEEDSHFNIYSNLNFVDEIGIAIYGEFSNNGVKYFDVERTFDLMQRRARQLGLSDGEEIPKDLDIYKSIIKTRSK